MLVDPSPEVVRVVGCVPSTQDQDLWPAYMFLMLAEMGQCVPRCSRLIQLTTRLGIIGLTLLKRYLEPIGT